ncbi:NAD-dependent epimerase/dehydratase family protein [Microbulbifer halophilus]|uniref:NAD-dependent epimerase/dehydratase family protein n=1 Tax=Microbulbifer halophilus TaxID=453963 RepID=A0ABW5EAQ8_9GAMM|nr:NAD-dependent epimerase/dehydratase family protein [Microbulbifer halophilus]MCW8127092.1 NAD-dependent epimerase/dehydratase family protein [Microbulbifer halophilus]
MARWVVIGGTGFIGEALCRRLQRDGHRVLSVSRSPCGPENCDHFPLTLCANSDFSRLFRPGDRVVYAAGLADRIDCERQPELAHWLNSDCPLALLRNADAAGAESFVYLSSVKALCPPRGVVADEVTGAPAEDCYGRSKWLGERQLLAEESRCRVNVIRPASVYGRSDSAVPPAGRVQRWRRLLCAVGRAVPLMPASGRRSFVALDDLLRAILLVSEAPCEHQVFIAAEPHYYDLASIVSALSGARTRPSSLLTSLLLAPLRPLHRFGPARALLELEQSELYSAARLRNALAWRPQERLGQFLREAP